MRSSIGSRGPVLTEKTFSIKTPARFGLVCEYPFTRNSNESTVLFNTNVEFLKVFLVRGN